MVRRRGTISVAKHKTAMERGDEPCRTRFYRSTRTCSRRSWTVSCPGRSRSCRTRCRTLQADEITGAARYERASGRRACRAGHYERNLTVKAGTMTPGVPKLKGAVFESAVIRTLPASRAERRGGAGRHVPGRRQRASGRRHRPPAVGRADALPDALRQAQARVRGHRSMAEPSPGGPFVPVPVRGRRAATGARGAGRSRT